MPTRLLFVALGGALGAAARYLVTLAVSRIPGPPFPYGTLLVNVAGCFAAGLALAALVPGRPADAPLRLFLVTGVLGGLTTFSAFSAETIDLLPRGHARIAFLTVVANVSLSLAAAALGYALARGMMPLPTP